MVKILAAVTSLSTKPAQWSHALHVAAASAAAAVVAAATVVVAAVAVTVVVVAAVAAAVVAVVTAVAVAATKHKTSLADLQVCPKAKKGAPGLLFSCLRGIPTTPRNGACFFNKSVEHSGLRGLPSLPKFAVIRQFHAESVIEISWLRFRDSIALSMCF